ncbi:leucine/isoleucine/valine-binding protein [Vitreoscilla sp. C1]|uniref:ABC transporter substrate-binding protein n=1 Tax=Vitreoscilla sp. (strain C1) TaxID=96942 RepID=UPI00159B810E|nr:ABC transporter substrate-binding protein [Vitreoscilla sp. C1]AUZ06264.2 leucine/isoleucine/valine-binding protein [Vitreoscilla sp. C1]
MLTLSKVSFAVAAALLLAACGGKPAETAPTAAQPAASGASASAPATTGGEIVVKLGTANPLTGAFAEWGKDAANGVKLAVDEANAKQLTWNGQVVKFELLSEDDMADPKTAAQVADRFVDAKVNAVIGHLVTGATLPASIVYNDHNIPLVAYSVTGPELLSNLVYGIQAAFSVDCSSSCLPSLKMTLLTTKVNKLNP